jgi:phage internal scaffolding protein
MDFKTSYSEKSRVSLDCGDVRHTKQSFKQECDVNHILRKYRKTGLIEHANAYQGDYSDVTSVPSYQDALNALQRANDMFLTVPSDIRRKFNNDAGQFLDFVNDPANKEALYDMGLAVRPDPVVAPPVEVKDAE